MRIIANNALVEIKANMNKRGDYDKALQVASIMVENSDQCLICVDENECEGYIVLSAVWFHYQREEWIDLYKEAKAAIAQ
jgi:hypothetical protein